MAFTTGQQVTAADLNAFSVTSVTTTGAITAGTGLTVTTGGVTVTAGGVVFPAAQSASADVNTLDDYEEGTWTPVIGGSGGTSGQTYTIQVGSYIKIGKLVVLNFAAQLSVEGTITGNVEIQGLPFAAQNTTNLFAHGALEFNNLAVNHIALLGRIQGNTSVITVFGVTAAAANNQTNLTATEIGNTTLIGGTISYRASA